MKEIARELLLGIEPRGQDATGMAWFGQGGGLVVDKAAQRAGEYTRLIKMNNNTSTAILHTRMATTGKPSNNKNNHPIVAPGTRGERVVLTHNGWVNNYASLTKQHSLARGAEVDSEVIAAMLYKYGDDYDKLGQEIDGNYALGYLREGQPGTLYLVRGHSSPLVLMHTRFGYFYASTISALAGIQEFVGGPLIGWHEATEGRAIKLVDGEIVDTTSFDMLDKWSRFYGNQVHRTTTRYYSNDYDDGWYSQYDRSKAKGRKYSVDDSGVVHLPGTGSEDNANTVSRMYNMWTTTKNKDDVVGRRVYIGQAAKERMEFFGIGDEQGDEVPSAYGKWVNVAKRGECVEFHPWDNDLIVEEAVFEDLLFSTADMDKDKLPDSIRYEMQLLRTKLDRKGGDRSNGVMFGSSFTEEHGLLMDGDGRVVHKDNVPGYLKVDGTWYFKQDAPTRPMGYTLEASAFQRDSDHINPRAVTPPAAMNSKGEVTDYTVIGEHIWGMTDDGMWSPLDLKVDELSEDEAFALGVQQADECGDDEDSGSLADVFRQMNAIGTRLG